MTEWLHDMGVATLYDHLTLRRSPAASINALVGSGELDHRQVRVRLTPEGDLSENLLEGVKLVHIPGDWDSVGGVVPDLMLLDGGGAPVRIVDVVESPARGDRRQKLDRLIERGVDVVEVVLRSERDLLDMCWIPWRPSFSSDRSAAQGSYNGRLLDFMHTLVYSSPEMRRHFVELLESISSTESINPIHPENPLRDKVSE